MDIVDILFLLFTLPIAIIIGVLILALPMAGLVYVWRATYPYSLRIGRWGADTRNFIPFISISFALVIFFLLISLFFTPFLIIVALSLIVIAFPTVPTLAVWAVRASRRYGPVIRERFWVFVPAAKKKALEVRDKAEDRIGSATQRGGPIDINNKLKNGLGSAKENGKSPDTDKKPKRGINATLEMPKAGFTSLIAYTRKSASLLLHLLHLR